MQPMAVVCYTLPIMKNYIIVDLEWNQSSQGKENSIEELPFEIIEIGAVKLDEQFHVKSEYHRLVAPKVYKQLHYKISEVTHMDMKELRRDGCDFEEMIAEFLTWCGESYLFGTWGPMDLTELQRNMSFYQIENPFTKPLLYYDIQKLYALCCGDIKTKSSLDTAVEEMGIMEERPFHRALDDAYYTARVLQHMDFQSVAPYISVDYYRLPLTRQEEIYLEFPDYTKYVSREFESKEEALADKQVTDMLCRKCRRMLRKKVRWFSFNQKTYLCLANCPEHGFVRGKIRMKKSEGGVYVVKTMKLVDGQGAQDIYDRKEELKKRRNEKHRLKKAERHSGALKSS